MTINRSFIKAAHVATNAISLPVYTTSLYEEATESSVRLSGRWAEARKIGANEYVVISRSRVENLASSTKDEPMVSDRIYTKNEALKRLHKFENLFKRTVKDNVTGARTSRFVKSEQPIKFQLTNFKNYIVPEGVHLINQSISI